MFTKINCTDPKLLNSSIPDPSTWGRLTFTFIGFRFHINSSKEKNFLLSKELSYHVLNKTDWHISKTVTCGIHTFTNHSEMTQTARVLQQYMLPIKLRMKEYVTAQNKVRQSRMTARPSSITNSVNRESTFYFVPLASSVKGKSADCNWT